MSWIKKNVILFSFLGGLAFLFIELALSLLSLSVSMTEGALPFLIPLWAFGILSLGFELALIFIYFVGNEETLLSYGRAKASHILRICTRGIRILFGLALLLLGIFLPNLGVENSFPPLCLTLGILYLVFFALLFLFSLWKLGWGKAPKEKEMTYLPPFRSDKAITIRKEKKE